MIITKWDFENEKLSTDCLYSVKNFDLALKELARFYMLQGYKVFFYKRPEVETLTGNINFYQNMQNQITEYNEGKHYTSVVLFLSFNRDGCDLYYNDLLQINVTTMVFNNSIDKVKTYTINLLENIQIKDYTYYQYLISSMANDEEMRERDKTLFDEIKDYEISNRNIKVLYN